MGLDMFLFKKIKVPQERNQGEIALICYDAEYRTRKIKVSLGSVSSISEESIYWRKSNQIHRWFVENIQSGVDDCKECEVPFEKLTELKVLCQRVLESRDPALLPPVDGFFFGSTKVDESYWRDVEFTLEELKKLDPHFTYFYRSSW